MSNIIGLKQIPKAELYRLIVDGKFHATQNGWQGYAMREPNCLPAIYRAMRVAFSSLEQMDVSIELIKSIHAEASRGVLGVVKEAKEHPGEFRTMQTGYFLNRTYVNEKGLSELVDLSQYKLGKYGVCLGWQDTKFLEGCQSKEEFNHRVELIEPAKESKLQLWEQIFNGKQLFYRPPRPEVVAQLIAKACSKYNRSIKEAISDEQKLVVITKYIQKVERIHPFPDVNGRVTTLLLQRLLVQNGFLPTMLYDPNHCDGFDRSGYLDEIKKGMQLTKQAIIDPNKAIHSHITEPIRVQYHMPPEVNIAISDCYAAEAELADFIQTLPTPVGSGEKLQIQLLSQPTSSSKSNLSQILARLRLQPTEAKSKEQESDSRLGLGPTIV